MLKIAMAEICNHESCPGYQRCHQYVLEFQISVHNAMSMEIFSSFQDLSYYDSSFSVV